MFKLIINYKDIQFVTKIKHVFIKCSSFVVAILKNPSFVHQRYLTERVAFYKSVAALISEQFYELLWDFVFHYLMVVTWSLKQINLTV